MDQVFSTLTNAIGASAPIALSAAFLWGILSILLSPCHLSSIPLVVAYMGERGTRPGKRAFLISLVFAAGILVTIGIVGIVLAPVWAAVGAIAALVSDCSIIVEKIEEAMK